MKLHYLKLALLALPGIALAQVSVIDDAGQNVSLPQPARRVVSLAPHTTELLYAAGGARQIVGAVEYSDYPPEARKLPRVGDNRAFDLERIIALKPDLLVVWHYGNSEQQLQKLRQLGIPVFYSEPRKLEQVATSLERLGLLLGQQATAHQAASRYWSQVQALRQQYRAARPVKVFYQVWDKPLMTLNGQHLISDVLRLCGGENLFARMPALAPTVSLEAVLASSPEAIISAAGDGAKRDPLQAWRHFPALPAVQRWSCSSNCAPTTRNCRC
ncbi:MAG: cobalamin-binding protein [Burkholderiales bacterium]